MNQLNNATEKIIIMANKYDNILECYKGDEDNRISIRRPRPQGDYYYSTDTHELVRIKKSLCENEYEACDEQPNFERVFPTADCCFNFETIEIIQAINSIPYKERIELSGERATCFECGGSRNVEWKYTDQEGKHYEEKHRCPVCNGIGKLHYRVMRRGERNISINGIHFAVYFLNHLINALNNLGYSKATILHLKQGEPMLINAEPGVDFLIMPNILSEPVVSLTLKESNHGNTRTL